MGTQFAVTDKLFAMDRITISVIIPTYKDWERLIYCIEALENQHYPSVRYEVIVVNNEKHNEVPDGILLPDFVTVVHEPRPGSYAARNKGAQVASGDFLAFTDSDCIPDKRWLINAERIFSEKKCGLLGGVVNIFKAEGGSKQVYIFEKYRAFKQNITVPKGYSVTANLFVRREIFERLEGFNSSIKSGGDFEFTKRAVDSGYSLEYGDDVVVLHPARRSLKKLLQKQRRFTAWGYLNIKREYGHSSPRIILSSLKGMFRNVAEGLNTNTGVKNRLVIASIEFIRSAYRFILQLGILLRLIDPREVRK